MDGMLAAIEPVSGLMRAIAETSVDQAAGVESVAAAIGRVERFASDCGRHAADAAQLAQAVDLRAAGLLGEIERFPGGLDREGDAVDARPCRAS
jgi:methyl-accepting chemotaxis protein